MVWLIQRWRSSIQSAKTRPGADCGSDHELCIAKFRLKLKKVGQTTRPLKESESEVTQLCPTLCNPMNSSLRQAPPSMGFSRQEYWSGLPFHSPGNLPDLGSNPGLPHCKQTLYLLSHQGSRPLRYDLNQIPYPYTVEVTNRFKGLDLIDRVPEELWTEVRDIVQEAGIKTIPRKRNAKRQNGCLRRP